MKGAIQVKVREGKDEEMHTCVHLSPLILFFLWNFEQNSMFCKVDFKSFMYLYAKY